MVGSSLIPALSPTFLSRSSKLLVGLVTDIRPISLSISVTLSLSLCLSLTLPAHTLDHRSRGVHIQIIRIYGLCSEGGRRYEHISGTCARAEHTPKLSVVGCAPTQLGVSVSARSGRAFSFVHLVFDNFVWGARVSASGPLRSGQTWVPGVGLPSRFPPAVPSN